MFKAGVNKQKHVVCGETTSSVSSLRKRARLFAGGAQPPRNGGNSKPQQALTTGLSETRTRQPPRLLPSLLRPFLPQGQSSPSPGYKKRLLNYPTPGLSKAPPWGPEVVFYPGRRREIREKKGNGTARAGLSIGLAKDLN